MKNTQTKKFTKKQPTIQANPHVVVALGLQGSQATLVEVSALTAHCTIPAPLLQNLDRAVIKRRGRGFPPATMNVVPSCFLKKTEEK